VGLVNLFDGVDVVNGKIDAISSIGYIAGETIKKRDGKTIVKRGEKISWHHMLLITHYFGDDVAIKVEEK